MTDTTDDVPPEDRDRPKHQRQPDRGQGRRTDNWVRRLLDWWPRRAPLRIPQRPSHDSSSEPELRVGWTVRLDWPDGSHDLVGFHARPEQAERKRGALSRYWRHGPLSPTDYQVVAIDETSWRAHTHQQADPGRSDPERTVHGHRVRSGPCVKPNCPGGDTHPTRPGWSGWSSWSSGSSGWTGGGR